MKNIFSAEERAPEVDPAFAQQAPAGFFNAPATPGIVPAHHPPVELTPGLERIAEIAAPGSAVSSELTYRWHR